MLIRCCAQLPRGVTLTLCRVALIALPWVRPSLHKTALENMRLASIPDPERRFKEFLAFLARHITRLIHIQSSSAIAARWTVVGRENFLQARGNGRPLVLAFFHMGAWEETLHVFAAEGVQVLDLYESFAEFPAVHREVQWRRELSGHRFLEWREGGRELMRHLREGGIALIAADMFPNSGGFRMEWFGRDTWVDDKAARVAAMTGAVLLPVWAEESVAHIEPAIDTCDPRQATRELLQLAERRIREHPHLWIWLNRRWREKAS